MSRYNPNPADVTVSIPVFPDGDYEFKLGEPKPFEKTNTEGKTNHGVRFALECTRCIEGDPNFVGKRSIYSCYQHTDGAIQFSKSFQMAVLGFARNEQGEAAFNEKSMELDWGYDPDPQSIEVGSGWQAMANRVVIATVGEGINPTSGEPNQDWQAFRPIES